MVNLQHIKGGDVLSLDDIVALLELDSVQSKDLYTTAARVKKEHVGNKVFFRGLTEFSNICAKDCLYCGIRKSNKNVERYNLSDNDIIEAARFAYQQNYASIVLQAGEISSKLFTKRIDTLLQKIHQATNAGLRITLSLGEQTKETYKCWYDSGAMRYLLRIETTNRELYKKIHPNTALHNYSKRIEALEDLKSLGYQTGTGVMIGLPTQATRDLANDLLFMNDFGIDMVGMGPYIEHIHTPLFTSGSELWPLEYRFQMTLKMISVLRILMPEINIAAATALQAIDKMGREKAIKVGANVIMPNITPGAYRNNYKLYDNKPCTDENADDCTNCLQVRVGMTGHTIGFGEWGDSLYYQQRV